jgi:magnesium-transporting ATPase (P-type)
VGAAVLAFVQSGIVLIASLYVFMFASLARVAVQEGATSTSAIDGLAGEGTALAIIQLLSVVALVIGGIMALSKRTRSAWLVLIGSLAVQVVLAVYWAVRLAALSDDIPGSDPSSAFAWFAVFFAAMPLVALGLVGFGPGRRWFTEEQPAFPG